MGAGSGCGAEAQDFRFLLLGSGGYLIPGSPCPVNRTGSPQDESVPGFLRPSQPHWVTYGRISSRIFMFRQPHWVTSGRISSSILRPSQPHWVTYGRISSRIFMFRQPHWVTSGRISSSILRPSQPHRVTSGRISSRIIRSLSAALGHLKTNQFQDFTSLQPHWVTSGQINSRIFTSSQQHWVTSGRISSRIFTSLAASLGHLRTNQFHDFTSSQPHRVTSGRISSRILRPLSRTGSPQDESNIHSSSTRGPNTSQQNASKNLAHSSTHNIINRNNQLIKQKELTINTTLHLFTTEKDAFRKIPSPRPIQYKIKTRDQMINSNTSFGTSLYSAGTHHGNLLKSF